MNGAESLLSTARAAGIEVCFANPGTTEMPLVAALDGEPAIRPVLALFEGVVTGAADGYARMAGRPALTLLHLGPGFANGIANLHNARRAGSPMVNLIGDQATWHRHHDAPLTSDIASLARPVSQWTRETRTAADVSGDVADAIAAANSDGGRIATLVVPADCQWGEAGPPVAPRPGTARAAAPDQAIREVAAALRAADRPTLLLGAPALTEPGLRAAGRIAAATGCRLVTEKFPARIERGGDLPMPERLGYFPEQAAATLAGTSTLVLVGAPSPVAFFGYPDTPSSEVPEGAAVLRLAAPTEDVVAALQQLADLLGSGDRPGPARPARAERPTGPLTPRSAGAALAAIQPENAIIVDEGLTSSLPYFAAAAGSPAHTALALTGGAIGQGLPSAVGAAIACPDRPVIAYQADGSGLYTSQALWTMAREELNVTALVLANRTYKILTAELARAGISEPGTASRRFTALDGPAIDWVSLAAGYGVPGRRAATAEDLVSCLDQALREPGPHLVELVL